jgi:hypothetical protein
MQIKFSRHAKRRADLYGIPETTISKILGEARLNSGKHEIVQDVETLKYPLKVVVSVENDIITVISNYPLKKGRRP